VPVPTPKGTGGGDVSVNGSPLACIQPVATRGWLTLGVACPVCGGTNRRPIGRGYWQCESPVMEAGWVPDVGAPRLRPGPVERSCGHRYQDGTGPTHASSSARVTSGSGSASMAAITQDVCSCGMSAIAWCVACGAGSCGDHLRYFDGRVVCSTHEQSMRAIEEERQRPARDAYAQQSEEDRAEYERLTPGFPYPQRYNRPATYADLRREGPLRASGEVPVEDVVRALHVLVPNRIARDVVVKRRTGLLSLSQRADGWVFTTRLAASGSPSRELQHDPSATHDGWWRTLLLPDGQCWHGSGFVDPGAPLPPPTNIGYMPIQRTTLPWQDVFTFRDELLTWLVLPPRPSPV
jgi:hypothetical protein